MFCPLAGTVVATRKCTAGYYCPSGTANPTDNSTLLCPVGHRCPVGSSEPEPCALGYFQSSAGQSECLLCPPGYACGSVAGTVEPSICRAGSKCPAGSSEVTPCDVGTYQDIAGSDTCKVCTGGFYCDVTDGTVHPVQCGTGTFCLEGSSTPSSCEVGYYQDIAGSIGCKVCPRGKVCSSPGTAHPTVCPAGSWCAEASSSVNICPPGQYQGSEGSVSCEVCPEGFFCNTPGGTTVPVACGAGKKCIEGSHDPVDCLPGTYQSSTEASDCLVCQEGFYCPDEAMSAMIECPAGSFCGEKSMSFTACPLGHFQRQPRSSSCDVCPAGFFCGEISGTSEPTRCPPGHSCAAATETPSPCELGSYQNSTGSATCKVCPAGFYCGDVQGTVTPLQCLPGTVCAAGSVHVSLVAITRSV